MEAMINALFVAGNDPVNISGHITAHNLTKGMFCPVLAEEQ